MTNELNTVTAVINGTTYTLKLATSGTYAGKWTAEGTAPDASSSILDGGYYPVSITASYKTGTSTTVNDKTGGDVGTGCRLIVKETYKPTAVFDYPANNSYITSLEGQYIIVKVKDNNNGQTTGFSGIDLNTFECYIDGSRIDNSNFVPTPITENGRVCGYSLRFDATESIGDGAHTLTAKVSDIDGNTSTIATTYFTVDTVPPALNVAYPENNFTVADNTIAITGTTDSTPVTVAVYLNNSFVGNASVVGGEFTYNLTFIEEGNQTIKIVATDTAGLHSETIISGFYSAAIPNIRSVRLVPTPTESGTIFTIVVDVV